MSIWPVIVKAYSSKSYELAKVIAAAYQCMRLRCGLIEALVLAEFPA